MLVPLFAGCNSSEEIEEIREQFFATQVENILLNLDRYTGRTIRLEGVFINWHDEEYSNEYYHFVLRFLDACCGGGGSIGFEVYMGDFAPFQDDAWVRVTGVLEIRDSWQPNNPVLVVTDIEELSVRGADVIMS